MKKWKCLNLGLKMPDFGILGLDFFSKKNYCHIWNQHPRICLTANFCEETKMPNFGTKNALLRYFWTGFLKQYWHIWDQHSQICLIAKFRKKRKILNLEPKMPYLGIFWPKMSYLCILGLEFEKNILIFKINVLEFVLLQCLIQK